MITLQTKMDGFPQDITEEPDGNDFCSYGERRTDNDV